VGYVGMNTKAIGIVTGARSDYGLLRPLLNKISKTPNLELLLYVTGMHLSDEYGKTHQLIKEDGYKITAEVDMLLASDSPSSIAKSMGIGTFGFGQAFQNNLPDLLIVLGDRFEMHCAAVASIPFNIPLAHIHGGELTYGAFDNELRHSLTKLSHFHFATTEEYAKRIKHMGEEPWRIQVTGALGIDNIVNTPILSKQELKIKYKLDLSNPVLLVTFHPVTREYNHTQEYILSLLNALKYFSDFNIIFTGPNADPGNRIITDQIKCFIKSRPKHLFITNFNQQGYLSTLAHATAMIGNSSSGIIEAPSFKLPVVNIGTRQQGRIMSANIINVGYSSQDIQNGLKKALSKNFSARLKTLNNPYGDGQASKKIVEYLVEINLDQLRKKRFYETK